MTKERKLTVKQAKKWLNYKESNGTHKEIIDVYNSQEFLPRGYKVKYTDKWCATFVSAVFIKCEIDMPRECSCYQMIQKLKKKGLWVEADDFKPQAGDLIFYDWQDDGKGNNLGYPDHIGIVEKVSRKKITVIEGNYDNAVKRREIKINSTGIRGFGIQK